jgi:hypothetical protein
MNWGYSNRAYRGESAHQWPPAKANIKTAIIKVMDSTSKMGLACI